MGSYTDNLQIAPERGYYLKLVEHFPLCHIRSEEHLVEAVHVINSLITKQSLHEGERAYLDVLTDMVEKYETQVHPMPPVSDADLVRFLLESNEITQAKLAAAIRVSDSIVSAVLAGKRRFTRKQVGSIAKFFNIAVSAFSFSEDESD